MLHEFIVIHRDEIIKRTRDCLANRPWPFVSTAEMEHGVPLFLTQLAETLELELTDTSPWANQMRDTAVRHGAELSVAGFSLAQVVHDYGDICQAVTDTAIAWAAPITVEEFHTLNRCLDTAIAEAVSEHGRLTAQRRSADETARLGNAAHELRDLLNGALLAYHALRRGDVAINGSTGAILGRSLIGLENIVNRTLSEVRLAAGNQRQVRLKVAALIDEVAATGALHAEHRGVAFRVTAVDPTIAIAGDPQLLASAIMNLLHNAFKNTHVGGTVTLRAFAQEQRLVIDVADECGGIPDTDGDLFEPFGERRSRNATGLGLGLSIARAAVRLHGGDIHIRNIPGTGCVFTINLPLVLENAVAPTSV